MGAQVTAVGCLAAPTHYSSENNLCTDVLHHHSALKALSVGFGHRNTTPDNYGDSASRMTTSLAAGTCPPADVALLKTRRTGTIKRYVLVRVTQPQGEHLCSAVLHGRSVAVFKVDTT